MLGSAITHVHVKDGRPSGSSPGTWELCLLNEGTVPLREACSALRHSGYDGYLFLEWEKQWHPELAEPEREADIEVTWNNILLSVTIKVIAVEILALRNFVM